MVSAIECKKELDKKIEKLTVEKEKACKAQHYELMAALRDEISRLTTELDLLNTNVNQTEHFITIFIGHNAVNFQRQMQIPNSILLCEKKHHTDEKNFFEVKALPEFKLTEYLSYKESVGEFKANTSKFTKQVKRANEQILDEIVWQTKPYKKVLLATDFQAESDQLFEATLLSILTAELKKQEKPFLVLLSSENKPINQEETLLNKVLKRIKRSQILEIPKEKIGEDFEKLKTFVQKLDLDIQNIEKIT